MNRTVGTLICLCVIIVAFLFSRRPPAPQVSTSNNQSANVSSTASESAERSHKARPRAARGDASQGTASGPIVHGAADFAKGDSQNLVIKDGALQLGTDTSFAPRLKPYKMFGVYVSPEQSLDEQADSITPNWDVTPFEDNEVTLEVRTKAADGNWSTWQEMTQEPNKPVRLETPGTALQYRLTFFANDPNKSPKVRSVSMTGGKNQVSPDPGATFSSNNEK